MKPKAQKERPHGASGFTRFAKASIERYLDKRDMSRLERDRRYQDLGKRVLSSPYDDANAG